ncbi:protein LURP-one-related 11-like protein [Carex littledalei]|uniref:Protein LURP-one-related 11-like protein n=1 Tax=Carex littledalei TaxID=544730 RepID=A0A833V3W7_9POAL|nr:protein LURP-one-related 11-like protein [Carex littledalei]
MAKVHSTLSPSVQILQFPTSSYSSYVSREREVFTICMKSLVLNSSGCAVYNSKGALVYRVDNYNCRWSGKVYLMDVRGKVLIELLKKSLLFAKWEGYRWNDTEIEANSWFKMKRACTIFKRETPFCKFWSDTGCLMNYKIDGFYNKSSCKILDTSSGLVVAEVKRKVTKSGIILGDDVLTLEVEPNIDHSLIMGLVLVYSLMNRSI